MSQLRIFALSAAVATAALLAACSPSTPQTDSAQAAVASNAPEQPASEAVPRAAGGAAGAGSVVDMVVYKDANCGCCKEWVAYMRRNGFRVVTYDVSDLNAVKEKHDLDGKLHACHTAEVGGYFVEGHVPADMVRRLLSERPRIAGIAVPGMPAGSPGMEVGYSERYDILSVDSTGRTAVFASR